MRSTRSRLLLPVVIVGLAAAVMTVLGTSAGASVTSAPRPATDNDEAAALGEGGEPRRGWWQRTFG